MDPPSKFNMAANFKMTAIYSKIFSSVAQTTVDWCWKLKILQILMIRRTEQYKLWTLPQISIWRLISRCPPYILKYFPVLHKPQWIWCWKHKIQHILMIWYLARFYFNLSLKFKMTVIFKMAALKKMQIFIIENWPEFNHFIKEYSVIQSLFQFCPFDFPWLVISYTK